jgi:hypothetical protein
MSAKAGVNGTVVSQEGEGQHGMPAEPVSPKGSGFDASRYLRKLGGRDYLEVKWRLLWLRTEHPDAVISTELVEHRPAEGMAVFKATVRLPNGGESTGWGQETIQDFRDYLEKAETKALGRALAALGYGTQFCEDFDFSAGAAPGAAADRNGTGGARVVDSPVELPVREARRQEPAATEPQVRAIYSIARSAWSLSEDEIENRCKEMYGCLPAELSRRQASELIDSLKRAAS